MVMLLLECVVEAERMQRNTSTISDRLRGILSDLSSFIGQNNNSDAKPVCESRDRDSFITRVRSFKSSTWFAKPLWLSPVICARYGWINVDIDLVKCVGCQSVLVVRTPLSFDPAIYGACQKRLEDQLKQAAHHPCCTWPSCPTPEVIILAHGSNGGQAAVLEDFINKSLIFYSLGKELTAIEDSSLNVTESDVTALCRLVRGSPNFLHDAEMPGALKSAVLLALTGWELSGDARALMGCTAVQCDLCSRQAGLWNYIRITDDRMPSVDTDNESNTEPIGLVDLEVTAVEESASIQTPTDLSDGQFLPYEIPVTTDADEDLVPSETTDKYMHLQETLLSSHNIRTIPDSEESLPNDDGNCSTAAAVNSDNNIGIENSNMSGVADTDENEQNSGMGAIASGRLESESKCGMFPGDVAAELYYTELSEGFDYYENASFERPQSTDNYLAFSDPAEDQPESTDVMEEGKIEASEDDGSGLDYAENASNHEEPQLEETGSDVEETANDSANSLTADGDHMDGIELDKSDSNADKITCSNVDVHDSCNPEDVSYESSKSAGSSFGENVTAETEFTEEAMHENGVEYEEQIEDVNSFQKDADTENTATHLTSPVSDNDSEDVGTGSSLEHGSEHDSIVEAVRQMLTDIIGIVIQDVDIRNYSAENPLKRRAIDSPDTSHQRCKRPYSTVIQPTLFNPVSEHHLWCPYISDSVCDRADDVAHKPWLRLLRQLVPDPEAGLARVQTSPVPEGIDRIRKLFHSWTSAAQLR